MVGLDGLGGLFQFSNLGDSVGKKSFYWMVGVGGWSIEAYGWR